MKTRALSQFILILATSLFILSCGTNLNDEDIEKTLDQNSGVPLSALQLAPAEDCTDLKDYVLESVINSYTNVGYYYPYMCGENALLPSPQPVAGAPEVDAGAGAGDSVADKAPADVSDTNNQEVGVNEGDIVKTDNNGYSYIVNGQHFLVAKGYPPSELSIVHESDLQGRGVALYLDKENKNVVVVVSPDYPLYEIMPVDAVAPEIAPYPYYLPNYTLVKIFNVTTPEEPTLVEELKLDGYYNTGRRILDRLHLVLNDRIDLGAIDEDPIITEQRCSYHRVLVDVHVANPEATPEELANDPKVVEAKSSLTNALTQYVNALPANEMLPAAYTIAGSEENPISYLSCNDVHRPTVKLNLGLRVITSLNTDGSNLSATSVMNNAYSVYASEQNLYLSEIDTNWWWLEDSPTTVTSQTAIYKFSISSEKPQYLATGSVDGHARNQFNFSEFGGDLRVATNQRDFYIDPNDRFVQRTDLTNNVFVLRDNGNGVLDIIGDVRGFAKDETLRSARFTGNTGFVVTFRQVDPLFSFDLSDPENPQLMGELTIPGFSTYMHPYDENHLITIGRSGGAGGTGVGPGMQFQLVDVSDLTAPKVLHSFVPNSVQNWSWSEAQYDHKAFTFYKPANLLSIPIHMDESTNNGSRQYFSGFMALNVTVDNGFRELGLVDHKDLAIEYYCENDLAPAYPRSECANSWMVRWAMPRRSYVMTSDAGDVYLYTLSEVGVKAAEISDLSVTLGAVTFPANPYPYFVAY